MWVYLSHLTRNDIAKIAIGLGYYLLRGFAWYLMLLHLRRKITKKDLITFTIMAGRLVASGGHYLPSGMDIEDIEKRGKVILQNTIKMKPDFQQWRDYAVVRRKFF